MVMPFHTRAIQRALSKMADTARDRLPSTPTYSAQTSTHGVPGHVMQDVLLLATFPDPPANGHDVRNDENAPRVQPRSKLFDLQLQIMSQIFRKITAALDAYMTGQYKAQSRLGLEHHHLGVGVVHIHGQVTES